jgi:AraC-like DNA-binding protein
MRTRDLETSDPTFEAMQRLAARAERATSEDGIAESALPFLSFIRANAPSDLRRGVLRPSVCFVAQGKKRFFLGDEAIHYGVGSYLASTIDLPASGQIIGASRARPYLGIRLEIEVEEVAEVMMEAKLESVVTDETLGAAFIGEVDEELALAVERALKLLDRPRDAAFLGQAQKREIIYRLLTGRSGHLFQRNVMFDRKALGVGKAIHWLKEHFDKPLKIEDLAKRSHMSVSSLHHKFKAVTTMGPLQYQKRLRLEEARRRLLGGGVDATGAAFAVGYESPSQFSREYRRLFGLPPSKDAKTVRPNSDPSL